MKQKLQKIANSALLLIAFLVFGKVAFAQAPTITSFSPTSGSIGTLVTIIGNNLNNLDTIKIGGVSAIKISFKTDTLVAMVMPGAITGNIYLKNSSGNVTSGSVFTKTASIPPSVQQGNKLVGTGRLGANIYQGTSVSISADGNTAIVGGLYDSSGLGAVWIYTRIGDVWSQQGTKLVGSGYSGQSQQGRSVSISADGNTAIVGGNVDNNNVGAVWIFIRTGSTWSQQGNKLVGTGYIGSAQQGYSVSLSADGNTAITGGWADNSNIGAVWIFTRSGGVWSQIGTKIVGIGNVGASNQGTSVSLSANGNTAIIGGSGDNNGRGAAWVYTYSGGVWNQQGNKLVGTGSIGTDNYQGVSVSLSADGNTALVGGSGDNYINGAAWVYSRNGSTWSQQGNKLVGTGNVGAALQGATACVSADGNTAIFGGRQDDSQQGAFWVFTRSGGIWSQQGLKRVGIGNVGAAFQGSSISLSADGNTAITGGWADNSNIGAVWVFSTSKNANLSNMIFSTGILSPSFSSQTINYGINLNNTTTSTTVTVTKEETNATIQLSVNGSGYSNLISGNSSGLIALNLGVNYISVKVTAQDGITTKIYTTEVSRMAPPTITSFSPTSGSTGTLVTITGTNLNYLDTIKIGNVSAIKISSTSTSLVAMVMPGAITGNIYLANNSGNITSVSSFTKTNNIPPTAQQGNKLVGTGSVGIASQGSSVAISADGNTAIIGGRYDDNYKGAVWIYTRNAGVWSQQGNKLVGTGIVGSSQQGASVDLSADGNTAIVGGCGDSMNKGAVWIFTRTGNTWSQQGNKLVGTGSIPTLGTEVYQGASVSISADGNTAVLGGHDDNNRVGAVWVFTRNGGIWSQQGSKLVGSGNIGSSRQGKSVSISANGNTVIVGGSFDNSEQGAAWIFTLNGNSWSQQGSKLIGSGYIGAARQGFSVNINSDGNTAIVGGYLDNYGQGAACVFVRNGNIWSQQGNKLVGTGSSGPANQGTSVDLSADGNTAIVGGSYDQIDNGAAWLFTRNGTVWSQNGKKRVGKGNIGKANQGTSIGLSADGNTAILGGPGNNYYSGENWILNGLPATNADLSGLSFDYGSLSPSFSLSNTSYSITTVTSAIRVTPTKVEPNSNIEVNVNGGVYTSVISGNPSILLNLSAGNNTVNVKVTAQDDSTVKIYSTSVNSSPLQPTITSFSPLFGSIGTLITITGTNLISPSSLTIGGVNAIVVSNTGTSLVAMVMPGANSGTIYFANNTFNVTSSANFVVTASEPPKAQQGTKLIGTGGIGTPQQGKSVSISADGNTAIVGGWGDNSNQGAAWVYTRSGGVWNQQGNKLVGTGNSGAAWQGTSVSLSADGNTAIVGAYNDRAGQDGAAWIFTRSGGVWSQQGNKLVGTGSLYLNNQGWSVGISADGNTAIVGGVMDSGYVGAAWIYSRIGGIWRQQGNKLVGIGFEGRSLQGESVNLSADGNTALVGGYGDSSGRGAVWVYTRSGNVWSQQGNKLIGTGSIGQALQGSSISLSADGNTALVGARNDNNGQGAVWVFTRNAGVWNQQGSKLIGTGNTGAAAQGYSVSLSADGNTAIVGGSYDSTNCNCSKGAVWVYKRTGSVWSQQGNKIAGAGSVGDAQQGGSVSISADGNTSIIGGHWDNNYQGAAWVFNGAISSNANLSALALSAGSLSPVFATDTITYTSITSASNVSVTALKTDTNSTIQLKINGSGNTTINSGIPSNAIALNLGNNTIEIKVTAQDSTTIKTYTITVNRLSSNAKLSNINLIGTPYLPIFHSDTLTYSANVLFAVNNARVSSILSDTSARIKIKMNSGVFTNINHRDTSALLPLNVGVNTIAIKVTAQDTAVTRTYLINITRAAAIPPSAMSYASPTIIATRTITNINNSVSYSGDSITGFSITPSLPTGVSLNTLTGRISGVPNVSFPQTVFTITGTNSSGNTTANFTLTVNRVAPTKLKYIDSIVLATRTITNINSSVTYLGDSIANFSISPALPTGLSLNTITGLISGIPIVILPKTTFTITGANNGGSTTASFTLTVNKIAPINLKYSDSIVVATRTITSINSSVTYSGDSITSFSISPSLPNGVTLNTLTGLISGTSTVTIPQTKFTITGTNNGGSTNASFSLTVNKIAPTNLKYSDSIVLATRTITNINSSVTYSGDSITSYSISPSLPNGVNLNTLTGLISGTPTVTIPQTKFTITGTNNGGSTTASFTLTVNKIAPTNLKYSDSIVLATRTITNINSSVTYLGDSIDSFSITPSLPNGVNLNTSTGLISGIPKVTIPQTKFTIKGTNNGGSTTASFTLTVNKIAPRNLKYNDSIVIATRTITNLNSSVTYSGDSIDSFSITPSLPNGVTLNTSTGLISGIPTVNIPQTVFTITGSNNGGNTTGSLTLTVNSPVSIKSINTETFSNINIKPNPFNSQIEIDFMSNTKEITQLIILDAVGKEVFSKNLESNIGNNTFRIDELTYLKGGIYFARLANNNGYSKTFKLIKE